MRKIILFIFVANIHFALLAQQDPQFAHNVFNQLYTNPAYAGMDDGISAYVISRQQWVGFEGAPGTTLAGISSKINLFGINSGVGISISDDRFEFEKDFQTKLSYSFHKNLGRGKLAFGIAAGFINIDINGTWTPPETPASGDPYIPQQAVRKMILDLNAGIFYQIKDKFYAGFSSTHINRPDIGFPGVTASFLRRHYFASAGYNFRVLSSPVELQPSVFAQFDGTELQYSINVNSLYNKKFLLGVSYRNKDAIYPIIGANLANGLKISYSYELSLSKLITVSKGTHEIYLGYSFDIFKSNKNYKYKSILYL